MDYIRIELGVVHFKLPEYLKCATFVFKTF